MGYGSFEAACLMLSGLIGYVYDQGLVLITKVMNLLWVEKNLVRLFLKENEQLSCLFSYSLWRVSCLRSLIELEIRKTRKQV